VKRLLPELLESPLVGKLIAHHVAHFGPVSVSPPNAEGIALHIGKRRVASLCAASAGPELEALALAIDALLAVEGAAQEQRRRIAERMAALGERLNRAENELAGPMHQHAERVLEQGGQLEEAATTCPLTGVLNRRGLEMNLTATAEWCIVEAAPLAVIMVDVDHFKAVNDNYGHLVGDQVLAILGRELLNERRRNDVVGRWGGEEFLLALPDCPATAAAPIAESIRARIAALSVDTAKGPLRFSASLGVAIGVLDAGALEAENAAGPAESLVAAADERLYAAKQAGRDRVELIEVPAKGS
jgi:diguanylate cyclase (GGDEF)-like protein